MRGLRQSLHLLVRCGEVALAPGAAGVLATSQPPAAAQAVLQQAGVAPRRWLHLYGSRLCLQQQHLSRQQQQQMCWQSARAQWQQRPLSTRPRGRQALHAGVNKRNTDQGWYLLATAVAMVGATYAAVPLYRMFCQATGYGGTVMEGKAVEDKIRRREQNPDAEVERAAAAREVTVYFNSDVTDGMPWKFVPTQRSVRLHPGQSTLAFYTAENRCDKAVTGVSTYNVAPQQAGQYFNKIQCFCFEEQKLRPGERIDMPVFFYIDPEFATDPKMKGINTITLSYTFFKVAEEDDEEDAEAVISPAPALAVAASAP